MGDRAAKDALYEGLAEVAKAMASGRRAELVDVLAQGERSVDDLAAEIGQSVANTSHHLRAMARAGLVRTRRDGTRIHYRLAGPDVAALYARLREVAAAHSPQVSAARDSYLGPADTEQVSSDELVRRARAGQVVVLDVRPVEEYAAGHIPGAVSIPLDQLTDRLAELPAGTGVVAYCRGAWCVLAHDAVRLLTAHGRPAARLVDGMLEWRLADLPVAVS